MKPDRNDQNRTPEQHTVVSRDGTRIAFERSGAGPVLILVAAALANRDGTTKLAKALAQRFTVINYDRRGRGGSGDTPPYAIEREVDDIDALIEASGGSALLFGSSSGAVLALEAASRLGARVAKLFLYEPPFITDASQPALPEDLDREIQGLVAAGRRNEAVKRFFAGGMGIPAFAVTLMRWLMPGWAGMAAIAHTIPYDLAVLAGTQSGQPLPIARWAGLQAPTQVTVGGKSEPFFHTGARALAAGLPDVTYTALAGRDHSAVLMAPQALADSMATFFLDPAYSREPASL
jgi:pimeloyl-ACP methyl ester carboxylesterase